MEFRLELPQAKRPLATLVRRQQSGRPLEDAEPTPLIERKQGHWSGLTLLDDLTLRRREPQANRKRSSTALSRPKTSASIVTQKTTLPQVETIQKRDQVYLVKDFFVSSNDCHPIVSRFHFLEIQTPSHGDLDQYRSTLFRLSNRNRSSSNTLVNVD